MRYDFFIVFTKDTSTSALAAAIVVGVQNLTIQEERQRPTREERARWRRRRANEIGEKGLQLYMAVSSVCAITRGEIDVQLCVH